MGQYFMIVNVDKGEYIHPHRFGQGLKLGEFSGAPDSVGQALLALTADGNQGAFGDLPAHPVLGSWAGDRVVTAGDYAANGTHGAPEDTNVYGHAQAAFKDVSDAVITALCEDPQHPLNSLVKSGIHADGWRRFADEASV